MNEGEPVCRIWGIMYGSEREAVTPTELARNMQRLLVRRGPDAWGWMSRPRGSRRKVSVRKFRGRCDTDRAASLTSIDHRPEWIVGHTRLATHGSSENALNNHPVRHGSVLGVHNGVIANHAEVLARYGGRHDPRAEVDSEAVFAAVANDGPRGLETIEGGCVCAWVDLRHSRSVWVARTTGYPLVLASTANGAIAWASEERALRGCGLEISSVYDLGDAAVAVRLVPGPKIADVVELDVPRPRARRAPRGGPRRQSSQEAIAEADEANQDVKIIYSGSRLETPRQGKEPVPA